MSEGRTPEQISADKVLDEAITQHNQAYALPDSEMTSSVVTEYVVIYAARGFTDEGEDVFRTVVHPSRTATPHGALGMIGTAWLDAQSGHYGWENDE